MEYACLCVLMVKHSDHLQLFFRGRDFYNIVCLENTAFPFYYVFHDNSSTPGISYDDNGDVVNNPSPMTLLDQTAAH